MSIKSIAGNLAAYALKRAYDAGKAIEIPSLGIVIKRPEPVDTCPVCGKYIKPVSAEKCRKCWRNGR